MGLIVDGGQLAHGVIIEGCEPLDAQFALRLLGIAVVEVLAAKDDRVSIHDIFRGKCQVGGVGDVVIATLQLTKRVAKSSH